MTQGLCVVWANLKPRKLADLMSEGMVMCAGSEDKSTIEIMRPPEGAKVGERVVLANPEVPMGQEMQAILNPKKKIVEAVMPDLRTNAQCEWEWKGHKMVTKDGSVKSQTLSNVNVS
jgi:aminoacyl tRNA synthase complex-interacting multifunctional protein 1